MSRLLGRTPRISYVWTVAAAVVLLAACGSRSPAEQAGSAPAPSITTGPAASAAASASGTAASTPGGGVILLGCDTLAWRTAPLTVVHTPAVPPVPVVTGIRPGRHPECRYDRITFDITGAKPGYEIRYVAATTTDWSGDPVTVPGGGTNFLLITFHPAQGHTDTGTGTIPTTSAALGYQMLKGYVVTGDFEGHLTVALGLAGTVQVRAGELSGRIYLDVAY
jgi:hypothetical protein